MVMLSAKKLPQKRKLQIEHLLAEVFSRQQKKGDSTKILKELLTESEYDTLLRRLTAMVALDSGRSYYSLRKSLGMSIRTLKRIQRVTKQSDSTIIKTLHKLLSYKPNNKNRTMAGFEDKTKPKTFLQDLDDLFGVLPRYGESITAYQYRRSQK